MLKRTLGKSGIEVSAVGMGCWAVGGPWTWHDPPNEPYPAGWGKMDDAESIRAIHAALDLGVNFFDTAANYGAGHSEVVLGQALQGRRADAVIATKFGHLVNEERKVVSSGDDVLIGNIRGDVENSLRRLQTDTIDIYQLHQGSFDKDKAPDVMAVLEDLVKQGKIRWYGWSTDIVENAAVFAEGEHCTSIQFRLNAIFDNPEMRQLIADKDLAGINKDPLNKGILTGKYNTQSTFPDDDIRSQADFSQPQLAMRFEIIEQLREVFTANGRTMAQGALAYIWALDERMVPIPGFKNVQQVTDNAGALEFGPLSADEMAEIHAITNEVDFTLAG